MRMRIGLLLCNTIAFALLSMPTLACECASPPPGVINAERDVTKWYANRSDVIFEGTVERIGFHSTLMDAKVGALLPADLDTDANMPELWVTFAVARSYKGVQTKEVLVTTGISGGDCGFDFEIGKRYLVFASANPSGQLSTDICSGTGLMADSQSALSYLRGVPFASETGRHRAPQTRLCGHVATKGVDFADSQVLLFRSGNSSPMPTDEADVAKDGSFCVDGANPGSYFLAFISRDDDSPTSYAFFPGTTESSAASSIQLRSGQTPDLEISLPPQATFSVRGTVMTPHSSALPPECSVFLLNVDRLSFLVGYSADVGPMGRFEFPKVLPGKYWAFVGVDSDVAAHWLTRKSEVHVNTAIPNLSLELVQK